MNENERIISLLFPSNLIFAFAFYPLATLKKQSRTHPQLAFLREFFSSRVTVQFSRNETTFFSYVDGKRENDAKKNIIKSFSNHFCI
jgi:hypothetical protein